MLSIWSSPGWETMVCKIILFFLLSQNYVLSSTNHSLLLKHHDTNTISLLVYVDDIMRTQNDDAKISQITHLLE